MRFPLILISLLAFTQTATAQDSSEHQTLQYEGGCQSRYSCVLALQFDPEKAPEMHLKVTDPRKHEVKCEFSGSLDWEGERSLQGRIFNAGDVEIDLSDERARLDGISITACGVRVNGSYRQVEPANR